jgi:hypothetical protein
MPRKNKRKFFGKSSKNKSAKLNENAAATTTTTSVSSEREQSDSEENAERQKSELDSNESAVAMGQVESAASEVSSETVRDSETQQKAMITLKVITQFIGEVPRETRDDESVKIADASEINEIESDDNDNKSITDEATLLLHSSDSVGDVPKLDHNKEDVKLDEAAKHQRSFDDNYRVESPKQICIESNRTPSKRHAMLIQEISESSSSEEVKQFLNAEAAVFEMKIDKVENATSPKNYRVDSPESSDENIIGNNEIENDVMVQEISESSSSESVKNEILASISISQQTFSSPALKHEPKNNLKIINIKELPSEENVGKPSVATTTKFECKTEKKLNKAEEAILEALYGNKSLLTIPNLPLDVISEEGSDCGSDIDKQAKRVVNDELDDDVFLPEVSKKPPLNFRRRKEQVVEQPQLLSAKIIETDSNIPEGIKSWETSQGDSELQAELVYLTSASSSATDLSERGGDVTDTDIEDESEDTETNSLLENISVPSLEHDVPIEMRISQKSPVYQTEYFQESINEQKLPDILEEDEDQAPRSLDIIESQQQIEDVNKELHHLVSEHKVIQTREKTVERATEEKATRVKRDKEIYETESRYKKFKRQIIIEGQENELEMQIQEMQSQIDGTEREEKSQEKPVHFEVKEVQSQVKQIKSQAEEIESQLEEIKSQVGEIKSLLEEEKRQETENLTRIVEDQNQVVKDHSQVVQDQSQVDESENQAEKEENLEKYLHERNEKEERITVVRETTNDNLSDKRKPAYDNDKARDDNSNRVTPTLLFRRTNSSESSSSANSQCTIIKQNVEHIDPLRDLCMQSLKKNGFTHDDNRDGKITIHKKLNSSSHNAPQIPIINELELHYRNDDDDLEGRENGKDRVITILQVPPEINRTTSSPSHAWRGLQSSQIPNLMVALSPLQQSYMNSQDSNTSADVLLDMHKKFVERRAYHESDSEAVENSNNSNSRELSVFRVNESQMESANQLEDGYFGDRESSVENIISKSPKANNSPEIDSNSSEAVAKCDNEQCKKTPTEKSAEIDFRMNSIRNCLLRDEFFRAAFSEVKRDDNDNLPFTTEDFPSAYQAENFEVKKVELENELKRLDNERRELEEELKNLQSLQHFKREEFMFNEKKLQSLEGRHLGIKHANNDFTEFINSNEKLQQELYNEWQDKVLERYERKLSKTIKITSVTETIHQDDQLERAASEILRAMPLESEFMTKLKERQKRLSLPTETELNSSTESLHHQNEEIKKSDEKSKNIPAHLYEFLKYYEEEEMMLAKNSDESGESKNVHPLLIGLIGVSMCLCGFYIGKYFITQRSKLL